MGKPDTLTAGNGRSTARAAQALRLLVVDDDPLSRSMMDLMLSPQGYALEFACDGEEAIQAIKTQHYDLVFMDLILPDMNGRDVCRQIREWEAGKRHVPIVAVTAFDLPGQPLELVKAGMDDYIFKPYDLRGLTRLIKLYAKGEGDSPTGGGAPLSEAELAETAILDVQASLQDFADDVESYQGLLRDFVAGLGARLDKIHEAHSAGDLERLGRECHSLKGISAGLGAMRLSRVSGQVTDAVRNGQAGSIEEGLGQIEQAIEDLRTEAQIYLAS